MVNKERSTNWSNSELPYLSMLCDVFSRMAAPWRTCCR